jgi:hypothetical protein
MLIDVKYTSVSQVPDMPRILESERTEYGIRKDGRPYGVYGIKFIKNRVDYLVCRTEDLPIFRPSWLFGVRDPAIPSGWKLCNTIYNKEYAPLYHRWGISCLIGYDELTTNPEHYDGILDLDETALRKFFRIKNTIDLELYGKVI